MHHGMTTAPKVNYAITWNVEEHTLLKQYYKHLQTSQDLELEDFLSISMQSQSFAFEFLQH